LEDDVKEMVEKLTNKVVYKDLESYNKNVDKTKCEMFPSYWDKVEYIPNCYRNEYYQISLVESTKNKHNYNNVIKNILIFGKNITKINLNVNGNLLHNRYYVQSDNHNSSHNCCHNSIHNNSFVSYKPCNMNLPVCSLPPGQIFLCVYAESIENIYIQYSPLQDITFEEYCEKYGAEHNFDVNSDGECNAKLMFDMNGIYVY
jgi:hypothetical protein